MAMERRANPRPLDRKDPAHKVRILEQLVTGPRKNN